LYLQLVLAGLGLGGRVEEIDGENLRSHRVSVWSCYCPFAREL